MGFLGFFLILLPLLAAIIGIIIALLFFIGACLLVIGVTGIMMNKIYMKQTQSSFVVSKRPYNVSSIVSGIVLMLLPAGYALYMFVSLFLS